MNNCNDYCNNFGCTQDCQQGRTCPARQTRLDMGTPYKPSVLDVTILAVALVFVGSCIGYLWGGL